MSARILVVDDDEGLRLLMTDSLRAEGYAVETAADARETLARLDRRPPDLLVLDLKLPDGGGPELIARLQRDRPAVPFVVVTGRGDEKAAVEVMKQGALDYVMKNSELLEHLPAVVRRALDAVRGLRGGGARLGALRRGLGGKRGGGRGRGRGGRRRSSGSAAARRAALGARRRTGRPGRFFAGPSPHPRSQPLPA